MTKEEKTLLTKVLCEQLPYGVRVAIDFRSYLAWLPDDKDLAYPYRRNLNIFVFQGKQKTIEDISKEPQILYSYPCTGRFGMLSVGLCYKDKDEDYGVPVEFIKPFLRPMSSMTEEEQSQLGELIGRASFNMLKGDYSFLKELLEYVNKNHIDLFGLIPMGLAIAAVGENNPYKKKGGEE